MYRQLEILKFNEGNTKNCTEFSLEKGLFVVSKLQTKQQTINKKKSVINSKPQKEQKNLNKLST